MFSLQAFRESLCSLVFLIFHLLDSTFLQGLFGLPQSSYAASKYTARHLNGIVVTLDRPASK